MKARRHAFPSLGNLGVLLGHASSHAAADAGVDREDLYRRLYADIDRKVYGNLRFLAGKRISRATSVAVAAPADEVFGMLDPARMGDWIEGWHARVDLSASGGAETDAIVSETFTGPYLHGSPGLETRWLFFAHDPATRIAEALQVSDLPLVGRYTVAVDPRGQENSLVRLRLMFTAMDERGNRILKAAFGDAADALLRFLGQALRARCEEGTRASLPDRFRAPPSPPPPFVAARGAEVRHTERIEADIDEMFRLACPVEELKWIDDWRCVLIHSEGGRNEDNCLFRESQSGLGVLYAPGKDTYWYTVRFSDHTFQAILHTPGIVMGRFNVVASQEDDGRTRVEWRIRYTGLSEKGNRIIEERSFPDRVRGMALFLGGELKHYLEEGTILRLPARRKAEMAHNILKTHLGRLLR